MSDMSEMQDLLQDFLAEAGDMLDDVDQKLIMLEHAPEDMELLNTIFRGFHTIKGGAGFLDAQAMVALCHRTENLFDHLRSGKLKLFPEMMDSILEATGHVKRMMSEMGDRSAPTAAPAELLEALDVLAKGERPVVEPAAQVASKPVEGASSTEPDWAELHRLLTGSSEDIRVNAAPEAERGSKATAGTGKTAEASKPVSSETAKSGANKENTLRVDTARFDQILNLSGEIGLTKNRLNCLNADLERLGGDNASVRTITQVLGQLDTLVSDLQTAVMKARMQPVGRVFQKYTRLARDVARQLGKDAELIIEGAETEVDKTILEELNDPLVHLIRNSVDHGLETTKERTASGKPARGSIKLSARQAGDHIIIEIVDDGRGMDPEVLRRKAVEKGLISLDEANSMDERQSLNLIFLPGFSTKTDISEVSGRGVCMDVVRTNIQRLKGRIELTSNLGRGSRVSISLPLTLAILPVLMMRTGAQVYAVPLSSVREIIPLDTGQMQLVGGMPSVTVRGDVLPVLPLAGLLGVSCPAPSPVGVVVTVHEKELVIGVDSLAGQDEVMVKPLEGLKPRGVTGATLSGDGVLVLVLELHELLGESL